VVIQLSPQIQSTEYLTESPEARQALLPGPSKTGKKDGSGIFAKLLAGLLQKNGKTEAESVPPGEAGEEAAEKGRNQDGGETPLKPALTRSGRKDRISPLKGDDDAEMLAKAEVPEKKEKDRVVFGLDLLSPVKGEEALTAEAIPETEEQAARILPAGDGPEWGIPPGGGEIAEALSEKAAAAIWSAPSPAETGAADRRRSVRDEESGDLSGDAAVLPGRNARSTGRTLFEKDGPNIAASEPRGRDRRKERLNAETGELRADRQQDSPAAGNVRTGTGEEASSGAGRETEITVEVRSMGKTQSEISMEQDARPAQGFQDMLARELHENLNGDIVRHASVMLREGGEGTIRLSLRPESLGSVKIRLEITENKIAGRIIVESDEAFRAFEQELHSLEQSFRESGFDGANLEMAFSSGNGREGGAENPFFGSFAASHYDAAVPGVSEEPEAGLGLGMSFDKQGRPQVNMLV
jgi:hypothetical protein